MRKINALIAIASCLTLISCNTSSDDFVTKDINIYRQATTIDKTISLRFYADQPNVPYIGFTQYYREFFSQDYPCVFKNGCHVYERQDGAYMKFDTEKDLFFAVDTQSFSSHPFFESSSSKTFLKAGKVHATSKNEKVINLKNYGIDLHYDDGDVYAPLTFLSDLSGGDNLYNIAYNGKDIYVIDFQGMLSEGVKRDVTYYKDTYYEILGNFDSPREKDLIAYDYNELCLIFDNYRGYTTQMLFGDNNLLSLGLNGLLELYHPEIKNYLLSPSKENYLMGYFALFAGLYDGGHTSPILNENPQNINDEDGFFPLYFGKCIQKKEYTQVSSKFYSAIMQSGMAKEALAEQRKNSFSLNEKESSEGGPNFYYRFDQTSKTSYIGFNSFVVDYASWAEFYKSEDPAKKAPVETDTYAFVRSKLYQALEDGAENVVLDLSTNGGGDSTALNGIYGILNGAQGEFSMNNTFNKYRHSTEYEVDVNLDGVYDKKDAEEADKFQFRLGVLTSQASFSCGNLLPSLLKESGYKIIGQQSGGGSCSVILGTTADGVPFSRSSHLSLSNNGGDNIDGGVPVDFDILADKKERLADAAAYFYDFSYISNYLNHAYEGN